MTIDERLDHDSTLSAWRNETGGITVELWSPGYGVVLVSGDTLIAALAKLEAKVGGEDEKSA